MKRRMLLVFCLLLTAWTTSLWAQSNSVMDTLLSQKRAAFGDAVYMVMAAVHRVPYSATVGAAIEALKAANWGVKLENENTPITLGEYSFLLMRAFQMQGGIMYHLFPGPRYAARELAYLKLIYGDASPYRTISGNEVIQILGNVMRYEGAS